MTMSGTCRGLMHVARERLDVFEGTRRQDAVPEIEDVPGTARGAGDHVGRAFEQPLARAEQQRGIEVALDPAVVADARPTPRRVACASRRR